MGTRADYLRLTRISLLPTAWSNVLMGFAVTAMPYPTAPMWLALPLMLICSGCLYAAGMAMNDLCDYAEDCQQRPERVLPSGKITRQQARRLVVVLAATGMLAAVLATAVNGQKHLLPVVTATLLLALICWYNMQAKHTALGPWVMGLCRTCNVLLGCSLGHTVNPPTGIHPSGLVFAMCMGLYVAGITWFAREEHQSSSRRVLLSGVAAQSLAMLMLVAFAFWGFEITDPSRHTRPALFTGLLAMMVLPVVRNAVAALISRHPRDVKRAVIIGLLTIIMIDASICYLVSPTTPVYALLVASLIVPAFLLSRRVMAT